METARNQDGIENGGGAPEELHRDDAPKTSVQNGWWPALSAAKSFYDGEASRGYYECPDVPDLKAFLDATKVVARNVLLERSAASGLTRKVEEEGLQQLDIWLYDREAYWLDRTNNLADVAERRRRHLGIPSNVALASKRGRPPSFREIDGEIVKNLRGGASWEEFARYVGLSPDTLQRAEGCKATDRTIHKLCRYSKRTLSPLTAETLKKNPPQKTAKK